jgi:hypothetical protein
LLDCNSLAAELIALDTTSTSSRGASVPSTGYLRVYIEVVTREDLETPSSVENMLFQLCEHLEHSSALVQLHIVERAGSLKQIATGGDSILPDQQIATRIPCSLPDLGHAANLQLACIALRGEARPCFRDLEAKRPETANRH